MVKYQLTYINTTSEVCSGKVSTNTYTPQAKCAVVKYQLTYKHQKQSKLRHLRHGVQYLDNKKHQDSTGKEYRTKKIPSIVTPKAKCLGSYITNSTEKQLEK